MEYLLFLYYPLLFRLADEDVARVLLDELRVLVSVLDLVDLQGDARGC